MNRLPADGSTQTVTEGRVSALRIPASEDATSQGEVASVLYAVLLVLLALGGVVAVTKVWGHGQERVPIDTKLESGLHLTFVLVAPTAEPSEENAEAVRQARDALRVTATAAGVHFSTVGISDHWSVEAGLRLLSHFGAFDEVVLGRNWLNSGVKRYITDLQGEDAVPQVVVLLQNVDTHTKPITYSAPMVVYRAVGFRALREWQDVRFSLPPLDRPGD